MKQLRIATVVGLALVATAAFAQKNDALSLIPADAVTVGVVKLSELRTSPLSSTLFQHADRFGSNGEGDRFLSEAGLDPAKDVDLLVVATAPRTRLGSEAEVVVFANGRFNVERLSAALVARGAVKKDDYFTLPEDKKDGENGAVAFPHSTLAIAGSEAAVVEALAARKSGGTQFKDSLLGHDAARIDANVSAWALVDVTRASRLANAPHITSRKGQGGDALAAAIKSVSTVALWATDTGDSLKLGAFGLANDAETLELLEDSIRGALSAMRLAVKDKSPELVSVLRRFDVSRTDEMVRVSGSIPAESIRKLMAHKTASNQ